MTNTIDQFRKLHQQEEPLLIGNAWNVQSARVFEKLGFKAIATSSSAVAETLGYADGEAMSFEEYLFIIKRISKSINLPLSVDLEAGYGNSADAIVENIKRLYELGVVGINLEDSIVSAGKRSIVEAGAFAEKVSTIVNRLTGSKIEMFINLRSDVFLLGLPGGADEAVTRATLYTKTGASGLFFPCVTQLDDIKALTKASSLPLNVMCMPALPSFAELKKAGVKRISMGNFLNGTIYKKLEAITQDIVKEGNFQPVFAS